jgi:hypothetical protein
MVTLGISMSSSRRRRGVVMTMAKQAAASILGLNKGKMGGRYWWVA